MKREGLLKRLLPKKGKVGDHSTSASSEATWANDTSLEVNPHTTEATWTKDASLEVNRDTTEATWTNDPILNSKAVKTQSSQGDPYNLYPRFVENQRLLFPTALSELRQWRLKPFLKASGFGLWFVLPTAPYCPDGVEVGSNMNRYFALRGDEEVKAYLRFPPQHITPSYRNAKTLCVDLRLNYLRYAEEILIQMGEGNTLFDLFGSINSPKAKGSLELFHRVASELNDREIATVCEKILTLLRDIKSRECRPPPQEVSLGLVDACRTGDVSQFNKYLEDAGQRAMVDESLYCAVECNRSEFIKPLVENGAHPNLNTTGSPLFLASVLGYYNVAKSLLENGADPNFGRVRLYPNGLAPFTSQKPPIVAASENGHGEIVQLLIDHGCDIELADDEGNSALHVAATCLFDKVIRILQENHVNVNIQNARGETPLQEVLSMSERQLVTPADHQSHEMAAAILLDHGADINTQNRDGITPLDLIVHKNYRSLVKILVENRSIFVSEEQMISLQMKWSKQEFLHDACKVNNESIVDFMLNFLDVDPNLLDKEDHTPLFYAAEKGHCGIMSMLIENGADANKTDERQFHEEKNPTEPAHYTFKDGKTPLFVACQNGHKTAVALLLDNGADPYLCNNQNQLPADVATGRGAIQQLLRIYDYFDRLEKGKNFEKNYWLCGKHRQWPHPIAQMPKPDVSDIQSIIHDIVRYPQYAEKFREIFLGNPEIVNWKDTEGRTVRQVACQACRSVTLFMRRYQLEDAPKYESATCQVFFALDWGADKEDSRFDARPVAIKFIIEEDHFTTEISTRRKEDNSPRFSADYVTKDLAYYSAETNEEYAKSLKRMQRNGRYVIHKHCIVMEQGERSLLEVMSAENLFSKELEVRTVLQRLCEGLHHLHQMGFIHGDVKPRNFLRHSGGTNEWKIIDFDACVRIGDKVGLKLSTGYLPPEMVKVVGMKTNQSENKDGFRILTASSASANTDYVKASESFDVWSFGMTMYHLVTGQSFFHCDGRDNLVDLSSLAYLTDSFIQHRLELVEDVNARVLLSSILEINPKDRVSMDSIRKDIYFNPSEMPQGRHAKLMDKRCSSIFRSHQELIPVPMTATRSSIIMQKKTFASEAVSHDESTDDFANHIRTSSKVSFFELKDSDKDWNDVLLESEVKAFDIESLKAMGSKPQLVDADIIYQNTFLQNKLLEDGPDFFMGSLVDFFELYQIMDEAGYICDTIKANLVRDVKSLNGIFTKLFVRGKGLNDIVRGTLFCDSFRQFEFVAHQLQAKYNVYMKPPKKGAWPIPKMLVSSKTRTIGGKCMTVEIQFSTVYFHLATKVSNNHLVYELMRESTGYLTAKQDNSKFNEFVDRLNRDYFDIQGFRKEKKKQEGSFEIISAETNDNETEVSQKGPSTGLVLSGVVSCHGRRFKFLAPYGYMKKFSPSSFVVDNSLTLLSYHSYWSEELYEVDGKAVEFVVSFKGRGTVVAGIGTRPSLHGVHEVEEGGERCSISVSRSGFVVRRNGADVDSRSLMLQDQNEARLRLEMSNGEVTIVFITSSSDGVEGKEERSETELPLNNFYHLYMRAPPGVHDVKYHSIDIQ